MKTLKTLGLVTLALALMLPGCKKGEGGSGDGADPQALLKEFKDKALPAVQGLVPKDGPKVTLEGRLLDKDRTVAAVPAGWRESNVIPGNFKPADDMNLGFMTSYSVGSNCDGSCAAKDWKATAEKVEFQPFGQADKFDIEKQEDLTGPAGKLIVAKDKEGKTVYIAVARWKEGAERYMTCRVTLEETALVLKDLFVKACLAADAAFLK